MKNSMFLFLMVFFIFFDNCKNKVISSTEDYSVSGILMSGGKSLPNATVSLDNRIDFTSQSNSDGYFIIKNVPAGDYTLSVEKTNSDGSYIMKSSDISVSDDIYLESLILPKGVRLFEPNDITSTSMHIVWNATDANDFREYKLYRHTTSGLDENTGTLAHVSTVISDTQFIDYDLNLLTTYFYRVYVMNQFGKLGGSNIISGKTLNENIIINGSFEDTNDNSSLPSYWSIRGNSDKFVSDTSVVKEGLRSLKINLLVSDWGNWGIYTILNPSKLEGGERYNLSFWYKADTLEQYNSMLCDLAPDIEDIGSTMYFCFYDFINATYSPQEAIDWTQYTREFTAPSIAPQNYYLMFTVDRCGTSDYKFNLPMYAWIDDVRIEKVQ